MSKSVILEVCVDSVRSALAAQQGGAARIELCSALATGGVTPSWGLVSRVRERVTIGLHVLIRPRGGDFCYDDDEFKAMQADIKQAKSLGADGVVFGLLNEDGTVDAARSGKLSALARPMSVTFHRAFDLAGDPRRALQDLIALGFDRILTSGQAATALEGVQLIRELVRAAGGKIIIIPGSGIDEGNARKIVGETKAREIHSSASVVCHSAMSHRNRKVVIGCGAGDTYRSRCADAAKVRAIIAAANAGMK